MSSDRMTEVLRYLTAISHDVGGLRAEVKELRKGQDELRREVGELRTGQDDIRREVGELRTEVRALTTRFMRLEAVVLETRADVRDLEERVDALEGKKQ